MDATINSEDKIQLGSKSQEIRSCQRCGKTVKSGEFVLYKDASGAESVFCLECEAIVKQELKDKAKAMKLWKPLLYGFGAMLVASGVWAAFTILSGWELGYVGIGAAYLICKAILKASKQARSTKLQILAVAMTVVAVFIAHLIILFYFGLKQEGSESQLFIALTGLIVSPQIWGQILLALVQSQGPIGWLIIAITIYTAYSLTNPKVVTAEHVKSQQTTPDPKLSPTVAQPVPSTEVKLDRKIAHKITGFTVLYIVCAVIGLFILFAQSIPAAIRVVSVLIIGALSAYAVKRTKVLRQQYPEQFALTQQANNKLSFKRVILYSLLGFFGLVVFIAALGFILG